MNGYKCRCIPVKNPAEAIEILANDKDFDCQNGAKLTQKAENEFDVKNVIAKHLEIYSDLL